MKSPISSSGFHSSSNGRLDGGYNSGRRQQSLKEKERGGDARARSLLAAATRHRADDVRVARIGYRQRTHSVQLAACGAQLNVVAIVHVHAALRQHRHVLNFRAP